MRGRRHVRFRVMRGRGPCGLVLVATKATAERTSAALAVGVMEIPLLIPARARAPSHSHLPPDISQQRARPGGRASHAQSPPRRPAGGPSALPQIPIGRYTEADHCVQPKYPVHTVVRVQLKAMQCKSPLKRSRKKKITSETNGTPWSSTVISRAISMAQEPCGGEWWLDR